MAHHSPDDAIYGRAQSPSGGRDFAGFVRAHQGIIRAFLTRLTGDGALADDLAQDSFIKAHAAWADLQSGAASKAWLFQIAYRGYLDHIRKAARRRDLSAAIAPGADSEVSPAAPHGLKMDIEMAMTALPAERRAILMMCLSYGMSHSEAAQASGLPLGTVKSHIKRGRAELSVLLADYRKV